VRTSIQIRQSLPAHIGSRYPARSAASPAFTCSSRIVSRGKKLLLPVIALLAIQPWAAFSQSLADSDAAAPSATIVAPHLPDIPYERPTQATMFKNYVFDAYGPYPLVGAAVVGGVNQWTNSPPEWGQGAAGFGRRFGSNFGIAAVGMTTRYGLAEAFKEDSLYYRCECRGLLPRTRHALFSTLTARRGQDGHRVFSIAGLVAPYAGSMTAVYGWYPDRFGAKDAFRIGNYNLLVYAGGNLALEFFYSGPHSLLGRMHLNNAHGAPLTGETK